MTTKNRDGSTTYERRYLYGTRPIFKIRCIFESFNRSPLTGLIISGLNGSNNNVLKDTARSDLPSNPQNLRRDLSHAPRISVIAALREHVDVENGFVARHQSQSSGFILELALLCSAVFASRANGPGGCDLETFLSWLCRELDLGAVYNPDEMSPRRRVCLNSQFSQQFQRFVVPFIAPMATESWDAQFTNRLGEITGVSLRLGFAYPSIKKGRADFELYRWNQGISRPPAGEKPSYSPIIVGKCKLHKHSIGIAILRNIIRGFDTFPDCRLFIVVAPSFVEMDDLNAEDYCVWFFARSSRTREWRQRVINNHQDPTKKRHILLLGLSDLNSSKTNEDEEAL